MRTFRYSVRCVLTVAALVIGLAGFAHRAEAACRPDWNHDCSTGVQDIFDFLADYFSGNADYNGTSGTTVEDIFNFLQDWFAGCSFDTSLTVSPNTGGLGTPITLTISAGCELDRFTSSTSASWIGSYLPDGGSSTASFTITLAPSDLIIRSDSEAVFVLGAGTASLPVGLVLLGDGHFEGILVVNFATGRSVSTRFNFTPTTDNAAWKLVLYPDGPLGIEPPELSQETTLLEIMILSDRPDPASITEEELLSNTDVHSAPVFRIARNSMSAPLVPGSITAQVVSLDSSGNQLDFFSGVVLVRDDSLFDPDFITYHADLTHPFVLVDVPLNHASFLRVQPLFCVQGGIAQILPSQP